MARKILLADDSVTAQNMGRKILADAGYEVIAVNNGSAALKKINEIKPDLVVLDVYMPGYSGLEVCQRLKESPETARIPVLLTVGKLEPFKPEEAQRVRAEGFIVKPFEASELLSALSKLEDKVVPKGEPSRPGRFARAFAAVGESDRVRPGEDTGWKSRISFPQGKSEAEEESEEKLDEQSSNPVNRDLRTAVEKRPAKTKEKLPEVAGRGNETVDLAALAPAGVSSTALPTDVTQEEVAAIAAAAAQIQIANATLEKEQRESEVASRKDSEPSMDTVGFEPPIREIDLSTAPVIADATTSAMQESKVVSEADSGQREAQDLPVTMAATGESACGSGSAASRWTAVPVALEGDEAAVSLHDEMQKAFAAEGSSVAASRREETMALVEKSSSSEPAEFRSAGFAMEASVPVPNAEIESASQSEAAVDAVPHAAEPLPVAQVEALTIPPVEAPYAAGFTGSASVPPLPEPHEAVQEAPVTESFESAAPASQPAEVMEQTPAPVQEFENSEAPRSESSSPEFSNPAAETEVAASETAEDSEPAPMAEAGEPYSAFRAFNPAEDDEQQAEPTPGEPAPDSETVKSTAAAWASWRQIRDNSKAAEAPKQPDQPIEVHAQDAQPQTNAAAAAAGAEQVLQAVVNTESNGNPGDVASIVDSVLAGLRPKLMEEISRKMAEKK